MQNKTQQINNNNNTAQYTRKQAGRNWWDGIYLLNRKRTIVF